MALRPSPKPATGGANLNLAADLVQTTFPHLLITQQGHCNHIHIDFDHAVFGSLSTGGGGAASPGCRELCAVFNSELSPALCNHVFAILGGRTLVSGVEGARYELIPTLEAGLRSKTIRKHGDSATNRRQRCSPGPVQPLALARAGLM